MYWIQDSDKAVFSSIFDWVFSKYSSSKVLKTCQVGFSSTGKFLVNGKSVGLRIWLKLKWK